MQDLTVGIYNINMCVVSFTVISIDSSVTHSLPESPLSVNCQNCARSSYLLRQLEGYWLRWPFQFGDVIYLSVWNNLWLGRLWLDSQSRVRFTHSMGTKIHFLGIKWCVSVHSWGLDCLFNQTLETDCDYCLGLPNYFFALLGQMVRERFSDLPGTNPASLPPRPLQGSLANQVEVAGT